MKRVLTALIAVGTLAVAIPAAAQPWQGRPGAWMSIDARQANLERRIDRGLRDGSLTRREADRLRAEFRDIARLEYRYRSGGLTSWERADLDRRFDRLAMSIRAERRDGQQRYGYGYGYDYNNRRY